MGITYIKPANVLIVSVIRGKYDLEICPQILHVRYCANLFSLKHVP